MVKKLGFPEQLSRIVYLGGSLTVLWVLLLCCSAVGEEYHMPDEPRYVALEYPEEIRNAPAGDILDFFPESWRKMDLSGVWKLKRFPRDEGAALDKDPGLEGGYQKVDKDW